MNNQDLLTWAHFHPEVAEMATNRIPWPSERITTNLGRCSQPTIVKGPDEELFVESQQDSGAAAILHSRDRGLNWAKLCEVPMECRAPAGCESPGPSPLGVGILADGTLLLAFRLCYNDGSGKYRLGIPEDASFHDHVWVVRSTDRGENWTEPFELDPSPYQTIGGNKARFHQMADGTAILPMNCDRWARPGKPLGPDESYQIAQVYGSSDGGQSWHKHGDMGRHSDETDFLFLPSGRILAATRYQRKKLAADPAELGTPYALDSEHRNRSPDCLHCQDPTQIGGHSVYKQMAICHSDDGAQSFSPHRLITAWVQQTGCLAGLTNGTVIMPFGHKDEGHGQRFIVSYDEGEAWSKAFYELHKGGMYASSVVLDDQTIVTAYAEESHSGGKNKLDVLRWKVPPKSEVEKHGVFTPRPI